MVAVVMLLVVGAALSVHGAELTGFVVDSPFDLTLGSTNYVALLGKAVHSHASAWYDPDTKVTTTNWSVYATVRFAKPYHGARHAALQFKGEERVLDSYSFDIGANKYGSGGKLTVEEARKIMQEVAADITKRFGVKMRSSRVGESELSDDEIDKCIKRIEEMTKGDSHKRQTVAISFASLNGNGEREGVGVGYGVVGMMDRKKKCSVGVRVYTSWRPKMNDAGKLIAGSSIPGFVSEAEQKKAHEAAKGLREALGKLFGIDFDSVKGDASDVGKNASEWVARSLSLSVRRRRSLSAWRRRTERRSLPWAQRRGRRQSTRYSVRAFQRLATLARCWDSTRRRPLSAKWAILRSRSPMPCRTTRRRETATGLSAAARYS